MSDEKSGCFGWIMALFSRFMALFGIKPRHTAKSVPHFRIAEKHVDFLLCNPQTIKPIVGIELDDEGHEQQNRKERDRFVKKVFEAAGLPLVHIPVQPKYNTYELAKRLAPYLRAEVEPSDTTKP